MKYCQYCGLQIPADSRFCSGCGKQLVEFNPNEPPKSDDTPKSDNIFDTFTEKINHLSGGDGKVKLPLKSVFSDVFKKHSKEESEEIFICGTQTTTPRIEDLDNAWPKPWLFSRVFLAILAAFLFLYACCSAFNNSNALPGLIITGSFMAPLAILIFCFEFNIAKNISFFNVIKIFLIGGCASLFFTMILFEIVPYGELDYGGAILVGIIEEIGKLGVVYYYIWKEVKTDHLSNGLLIGAAIGAGFAAFESAGYAFNFLGYGFSAMMEVIILRGVLALGGHVVWAAMSGYALMLVKGNDRLSFSVFQKTDFWKIFWIPVVLHAVWDMPIEFGQSVYLVPILLTVLAWIVIFVMLNNCLKQIGNKTVAVETEKVEASSVTE